MSVKGASNSLGEKITATFARLKYEPREGADLIPIPTGFETRAWLRPLTMKALSDGSPDVRLLTEWRNANRESFFSWFPVTLEGTGRWFEKQVLEKSDRILFMVEANNTPIGHIGFSNLDSLAQSLEIDNVLRGRHDLWPGGMLLALKTLLSWAFGCFDLSEVHLRVFSDNVRAISLYEKCGFHLVKRVPLLRLEEGVHVRWVETEDTTDSPLRCADYMRVAKP